MIIFLQFDEFRIQFMNNPIQNGKKIVVSDKQFINNYSTLKNNIDYQYH